MGAEYQEETWRCKKAVLSRKFNAFVRDCQYDYGHAGYTGTFAEKPGLTIVPPPEGAEYWTLEEATKHCGDNNDKWENVSAYQLAEELWYVGGWCSS